MLRNTMFPRFAMGLAPPLKRHVPTHRYFKLLGLAVVLATATAMTACSDPSRDVGESQPRIAPLLKGLGSHTHPVTTRSPLAQRYFDQGLNLVYAFNHAEAIRSFRQAALIDPDCAMAYWGQALALGPNINAPMSVEHGRQAYEAIQLALKSKSSESERAYIDALAKRYSKDEHQDRKSLDRAYAGAMRNLAEQYPQDDDAQTLYAAALMNLRPWSYWQADGSSYSETAPVVPVLEAVLKRNPGHIGANHYYIHAVEATDSPERAVPAAERLQAEVTGAGHLVHMPAHVYIRVGRYADASEANVRAIAADENYITQCRAQGIYPLGYYPHNIHFLWASSSMEGHSQVALEAAEKVASKVQGQELDDLPSWARIFTMIPLYAKIRFGKWDDILRENQPQLKRPFYRGIWHFARGLAFNAKGPSSSARKELDSLHTMASDPSVAGLEVGATTVGNLFEIASLVLSGEIEAKQRNYETAISHLDRAVRLQDGLPYNEPPDWYYPVRQSLGAVLLAAGRPAEAETVYWQDLKQNPENGWSLFGLAKSLWAEGKKDEAVGIEKRFQKAWSRSDVKLAASRF
jgi:tetratricopeptide (TPR) repeat protein